jgi:hypothetical protein
LIWECLLLLCVLAGTGCTQALLCGIDRMCLTLFAASLRPAVTTACCLQDLLGDKCKIQGCTTCMQYMIPLFYAAAEELYCCTKQQLHFTARCSPCCR